MRGRSAALTLVAVLGGLAGAWAAVPAYLKARPDAAIRAFGSDVANKIFSDDFTPLREEAVLRSAKTIPGFACPDEPQIALTEVIPYPVRPGAVSWIETYDLACSPRARRNFLLLLDGERGRIAELIPGSTMTDLTLQHEASHGAKALVKSVRPESCARTVLIDTHVTTPPKGGSDPWVERWTFDQCAVATDVEMTFTPSARRGVMWSARLVK